MTPILAVVVEDQAAIEVVQSILDVSYAGNASRELRGTLSVVIGRRHPSLPLPSVHTDLALLISSDPRSSVNAAE